MTHLTTDEAALLAASQANKAVAALLQFQRDGAHSAISPFENDVAGPLAEALGLVLDLELTDTGRKLMDADELQLFTGLRAAVDTFLAGWVG